MITQIKQILKTAHGRMTFRHIKHYVGAVYVAQIFAAARSFINARYLGPSDYGFWGWLVFIISLGYFLHLGAQEMMLKEVPALQAKGQHNKVHRLIQLNFTFFLIMLSVASVLIAILGFNFAGSVSTVHRVGWIVVGVVMIAEVFYYFEQVVARSMGYFSEIGRTLLVTNVVSLALTCWLVIGHGMSGIYWVALLTPVFGFMYMHRTTKYPFKFVWDGAAIKEKIKSGWPIVTLGLFFLAVGWVDRGIIMKFLGVTAHGYYTFGSTIAFMLFLLPKGLADIFEPKLHFHHTEEKPGHSINKNFLGPVRILAWLMPSFLLVGHVLLPWILKWILPAYQPGLLVMRILIWTSYFVGLMAMAKSSLVALNKQLHAVPIIVVAIVINIGVSLWMVAGGFGVAGVAVGSMAALGVASLLLTWLIIRELNLSDRKIARLYLEIFGPFILLSVPCLLWAWTFQSSCSSGMTWLHILPIAGVTAYFSTGIYILRKWLAKSEFKQNRIKPVEVIS